MSCISNSAFENNQFPTFSSLHVGSSHVYSVPFEFNVYDKQYSSESVLDLDYRKVHISQNYDGPLRIVKRNVCLKETSKQYPVVYSDLYTCTVLTPKGKRTYTKLYLVPPNIAFYDDIGPCIDSNGMIINKRPSYLQEPFQ